MTHVHNPVRQLKYLRQTLSQNKKPLGFFLSAGCPLAVKMPDGQWPLIPDIAGLTKFVSGELSSNEAAKNAFDRLLDELKKAVSSEPNIEEILSFVRGLKQVSAGATDVRGLTKIELEKLEKDICQKIVDRTRVPLPNRSTPYHQLAQWMQLIDRDDSPIECFTTNYDLLLEQALEETGVAYFDGFVGSRRPFFDLRAIEDCLIPKHWSRLWKVHGSINWFMNDHQEVFRSTDLNPGESHLIHPSHLKYDESRKMPYLALIDRLNAFLRQTSSMLITCGYSFNDIHINNTIMNALRANSTSMVIALLHDTYTYADGDGNQIPRYERAFSCAKERLNLSAWCFDEAVIGGVQGTWRVLVPDSLDEGNLGDAIAPTNAEIQGEGEPGAVNYHFKLGDFAIFGSFLQALIGSEKFKLEDAE